jgi:type I restriction enzyme M protein
MTDVAGKLWGFCHVLRHDGIDYGDYIEQLTYLLFLKMADERGIELPTYEELNKVTAQIEQIPCDWPYLRKQSGIQLTEHYTKVLDALGKQPGILGDIFGGAQNRFGNPVNLHRLIGIIDETEWTALDVDVKAAAFEGLLERAAAEGRKGAGQYFTPRPLIQAMVRCIKPDPRVANDFTIGDPACGTGGFVVAAYEWLKEQTKDGALARDTAKRVRTSTYYGQDLVARPRRLALMNLYLHQVEPHITLGDSIYDSPSSLRFNVVLTNPPFGTRGANQAPDRDDFTVATSNKQLNFIQHVMTILKRGGRVAMVVPDNVLFEDQAGEVFKILMEDCDLHTVLRCPHGTFTPYTQGTQTNVIFFTKGRRTEQVWIYDARTNLPRITKKGRPLTSAHFAQFEQCYGVDPNGQSQRSEDESPDERWRAFSIDEVKQRRYKLDSLKWLREEGSEGPEDIAYPEELITEAIGQLRLALDALTGMQAVLSDEAEGVS